MSEIFNLQTLTDMFDRKKFVATNRIMSFSEYVEECKKNPKLIRTAPQRIYDMVVEDGFEEFKRYRRTHKRYNFFNNKSIPIFGIEESLEQIVEFLKGAAGQFGPERRVLLLHGPVGSSKSTICRLLKRGLEDYSRTDAGCLYTYNWINLPFEGPDAVYIHHECPSAMNEDPIKLLPMPIREAFVSRLNDIMFESLPQEEKENHYSLFTEGNVNPRCKFFINYFLRKYDGDIKKVLENHIEVTRLVISEDDRVGIGTFQPKDEKNQDATELTGDINYRNIAHFGKDSDARAFNFDGEFNVGNRGVVEMIEVLKLQKEFLYDLLGASQEHNIKPKKFSQVSIDEVIIGHTNSPEFKKLQNDQTMEAFRDRTIKVDIPYLLRWSDEIKIYKHHYRNVKQHIMPHTLEIAAFWAVLTRHHFNEEDGLDIRDKVKLYDGRHVESYTEDRVKELRDKYPTEGMDQGISARYVQDKIANCLARHEDYVGIFMVMDEIERGLNASALISNPQDREKYAKLCTIAVKELDDILKREVQKALVANDSAIVELFDKYIDNMIAYVEERKVINKITKREERPNERLMRDIERKIKIPDDGVDQWRRSIASFIGGKATRGETFSWESNERLRKALEAKLFEDVKDHINLSKLSPGTSVIDEDSQKKIDIIKERLVKYYGYNEKSATDVLEYVSGIFARGDISEV